MSAVKRGFKKVGKFIKKNWKKIVIAAAIVFTAGIATVGVAGFGAASAAAGGGIGGFISAAGSTMAAGVASIGGSLGIGQGANLAAFGGSGYATLGTGAAAQSLGFAGSNAAMTAGRTAAQGLAAPAASLGGGPPAALAGSATSGAGGGGAAMAAQGAMNAGAQTAATAGQVGAQTAAQGGGFLNSPMAGPLLNAGMGLLGSYSQARAEDEQWERIKPRGMWGVGLNGEEDAAPPGEEQDPRFVYDTQSFGNPNTAPNTANQGQVRAPTGGLIGNSAFVDQNRSSSSMRNPLSAGYDPALARINRGASYG